MGSHAVCGVVCATAHAAQSRWDPPLKPPSCLCTHARVQDQDGRELGVAGSLELLSAKSLSSQPLNSFDWSPDRAGLFVCSAFDQVLRVGIVTRLERQ